jgi:hypothetical protein
MNNKRFEKSTEGLSNCCKTGKEKDKKKLDDTK